MGNRIPKPVYTGVAVTLMLAVKPKSSLLENSCLVYLSKLSQRFSKVLEKENQHF